MKYAFVAVALAALARAQTLGDIPSCALPCIDDAISSESKCKTTDFACICKKDTFSAIQGASTSCVIEKCGADTALNKVLPATEALCKAQGSGGDSTTTESTPETTTTESTPSTTEEATTSAEASTSAAATTVSSVVETTVAVTTSTWATTVAPTATPPTNGTVPTTTGSVVPTGAAAVFGPAGGLAMLGLAALAL